MKQILSLIILVSLAQIAAGQRTYYNRDGKVVDASETYSRSVELTQTDNGWTYVKAYDADENLYSEGAYSIYTDEKMQAEGMHKHYNKDGKLWYTDEFEAGKRVGELRSYYPSGALKRIEQYKDGVVAGGKCYEEDGSPRAFTAFEQQPQFPGGEPAMMQHLMENLQYPKEARNNNITGQVVVSFVVNKDGHVSDIKILKDIGGGCGEESVRVIEAMPNWIPGYQDDSPVKVRYTLPLKFKLEGGREIRKRKRNQ